MVLSDCGYTVTPNNGFIEVVQLANKYTSSIQSFKFYKCEKKRIVIGRDRSCNIKLNYDKTSSKFQASIIWDEEIGQWYIIDGKDDVRSRNGSWVYATKSYEIYDGLMFKVGTSKVKVIMSSTSTAKLY